MRVLMVTPSYYPIKGGAEAAVRSLATKLNEIGVQTNIMTFNMNRKWHPSWKANIERTEGVTIFKVPAFNWFPMKHSDRITLGINLIPGRFRNHIKKHDIIHFHGKDLTFPFFSCALKKPKLFHSHGFSVDFYKRHTLNRLILKHIADVYISISRRMTNELVELGIPKSRIAYLPNAVNTQVFHPSGEKEKNLILFVGRITFSKGLHNLLKSIAYLSTPIHLVVIGPPDWDTDYFQEIKEQIKNETGKSPHKITYLGPQDQKNIVEWYQRASIFVLPSYREAFPMVNLEALACETPVVATDVGGISDVIRHGENGILIPKNNAVRLAEAIQYLLDNVDVRVRFGREGRRLIVRDFSLESIAKKLSGIYKKLIAGH